MVKRDGAISYLNNEGTEIKDGTNGATDFTYPEVEVAFGTTSQKISLGFGFNGYETDNQVKDARGSATISTTLNAATYSKEIFGRKEYDSDNSKPKFCIYQKQTSSNGSILAPYQIGCVDRQYPEIKSTTGQSVIITESPANTYNNATIKLKYSINGATNCIDPSNCSTEISLKNDNLKESTCNDLMVGQYLEGQRLCVQRDPCSALNKERVENEINLQNAKLNNQATDAFEAIKEYYDNTLTPECNNKKGLSETNLTKRSRYYGWFNELCFVSGFEKKLKKVVSYQVDGNQMGKCKTIQSEGACPEGGKPPNCVCLEYIDEPTLNSLSTLEVPLKSRTQTPREAGLCIDIPNPATCPAIAYTNPLGTTYNGKDNTYYVASSLGNSAWGITTPTSASTVVDKSHQYRSTNSTESSWRSGEPVTTTALLSHAEFSETLFDINSAQGYCRGFWKNSTNGNGVSIPPTRDCIKNSNGTASWSSTVNNPCQRYSCPAQSTSGSNSEGDYDSSYNPYENGYANWSSFTKIDDFSEIRESTTCIPGYKKNDSSATKPSNIITGYSGGTKPTRACWQNGKWQAVTDSCVKITCPQVKPPANPTKNADWAEWYKSGGATFDEIDASLSSYAITPKSTQIGDCNEDLGFFQTPGSSAPTRTCDHLGNWSEVSNKCSTKCEAIGQGLNNSGDDSNNGFAEWAGETVKIDQSFVLVNATKCITGYVKYPYPPLKNSDGVAFTLSDNSPNDPNSIALTIPENYPTTELPKRKCKTLTIDGKGTSFWSSASSSCINKCPGYDQDRRIGAGATKHNTAMQGTIIIHWPQTDFGNTVYAAGIDSTSEVFGNLAPAQNAAYYSNQNRSNGYFMLARKCGTDGKWADAIPQCVTNDGEISGSNALYGDQQITNGVGFKSINVGSIATSDGCKTGYTQNRVSGSDSNLAISSYTCSYSNAQNKNIDQTYFAEDSNATTSACVQRCQIPSEGDDFGSGSEYKAASNGNETLNGSVGERVTLACRSGYGHALGSGSDNTCGRNTNDRISAAPSMECKAGGTWEVSNDCKACRGCDSSSDVEDIGCYGRSDCYQVQNKSGFCGTQDTGLRLPRATISNLGQNESKTYCQNRGNLGATNPNAIRLTTKCVDGFFKITAQCQCRFGGNWNSWGGDTAHNTWISNSDCPTATENSSCSN